MSTKHQWLQTLESTLHQPYPPTKILTGITNQAFTFFRQRAVIPAGWHSLKIPIKSTTGVLVLLVTIAFAVSPSQVQAAIVINEVFPAPDSTSEEWVELYNDGASEQNVFNWFLEDRISSASVLYQLENITIPAGGYQIVNWPTSKLNNSGDSVHLYDFNLTEIDQMTFSSSETNKSWSRITTNSGEEWQLTDPTPGRENQVSQPPLVITPMLCSASPSPSISPSPTASPQPSVSPSSSPSPSPSPSSNVAVAADYDIYISSVMACPTDTQSEYVEVFNTSTQQLSTQGWYLLDAADNKRYLLTDSQPTILPANAFTTVSFASSFINNSGETLFLYTPDDKLVQTIELPRCEQKGITFVQQGSTWTQSVTTTTQATTTNQQTASNTQTTQSTTTKESTVFGTATTTTQSATVQNNNKAIFSLQGKIDPAQLQLSIPQDATNTFKEPAQLLKDQVETIPLQAILAIIIGGFTIAGTSSYKLLSNLGIL
jgi:hypothetical protein